MTTINLPDLANRVLIKATVLAPGESADAADLLLGRQKLVAVHEALRAADLLRWSEKNIPLFAQEPYVMMAAFLAAPEFSKAPDGSSWLFGLAQIEAGIQTRKSQDPVYSESF